MTQTLGKVQAHSTEVVLPKSTTRTARPVKRSVRMIGAGLVSAALVGVFALPAYAVTIPNGEEGNAPLYYSQSLNTVDLPELPVPLDLPTAEEKPVPVAVPAASVKGAAAGGSALGDLPAGVGASGIASAAVAQLGWAQDCTDLVQNSVAAIGLVTPRLQGGPDLGISSFDRFGSTYGFNSDNLAPGDLLVWPGAHIAVYVGGGQVVHGGWEKSRFGGEGGTVMAGLTNHGAYPAYVVRIG